jgi:hypothetical protein
LSSRAFANVLKSFSDEAEDAFSFLATEFGLAGPDRQSVVMPTVSFVGSEIRYRIRLDADDQAVVTQVERDVDSIRLVADLPQLVSAAGFGPANQVTRNAHTLHNLQRSLDVQAKFVRRLHPILVSSEGVGLLINGGARKWQI